MKTILRYFLAFTALFSAMTSPGAPAGTAFTYQGRLASGGSPITGLYDFAFALYDVQSGPGQVGEAAMLTGVGVTNGLFTVPLDFGNAFDGSARWLGISVKTNGAAEYTDLTPRQALMPSPYALVAAGVVSSGTVQLGAITSAGQFRALAQ